MFTRPTEKSERRKRKRQRTPILIFSIQRHDGVLEIALRKQKERWDRKKKMSQGIRLIDLEKELDYQERLTKEQGQERNQEAYEGIFEHYLGVARRLKSHYSALLEITSLFNKTHTQLNQPEETA